MENNNRLLIDSMIVWGKTVSAWMDECHKEINWLRGMAVANFVITLALVIIVFILLITR